MAFQNIILQRLEYYITKQILIIVMYPKHARKVHHQSIIKGHNCGMDFLHEEDRLHHVQQEKEKKADIRRHR